MTTELSNGDRVSRINGVDLRVESCGDPNDPAALPVLLIAHTSGKQG
ncbi:hypothetical protein [Kribbella deserti]|uniref:Alpha/beta hydrolase n=1 Tax=Kribbella deserti TaxID=1926257 RepID=A0ABV6QPY5_9ACTN